MNVRPRPSHFALGLVAAGALMPRVASAQFEERLSLHLEAQTGGMIGNGQVSSGLALGGVGAVRVGIELFKPLSFQIAGGAFSFPSNNSGINPGFVPSVTGGLRLEPLVGYNVRPYIDGNVGPGFTGSDHNNLRLTWNAGIGIDVHVAGPLFLGPVARIGELISSSTDPYGNVPYWSLGLSIGFHAWQPPPPPPPPDTDRDGVPDLDDLCPTVPAGEHPDPHRRGCPLTDTDRDLVWDPDDLCREVPAGEHPDPQRPGCPMEDRDHDGVYDPEDQCPDVPAGEHPDPHRAGCPDGDDDHDGVLNAQDDCPHDPAGDHPDAHHPGCPTADRDHDTVPDDVDHCPDQPGAPSPDPLRNGCPGLVQIEGGQVRINRPVFFATNRDTILPASFPVLQAVADALRATPSIHRVAVEGHTDNVGPEARNMTLSQHRADSVMHWLAAHEVDAGRLEAHGYGPSRPVQPNTTSAGRAANRRVEFHIVDPAPAPTPAPTPAPAAH